MGPAAVAFMGVGLFLQAKNKVDAAYARANAEEQNASFYREQAAFAREAGDRQLLLFDRQSKILYGEQESAFAKAGIDTAENSRFMAQQMLYGSQEKEAIKSEADMNVRLATLRADQAQSDADNAREAAPYEAFGTFMGGGSQIASRY